MIIGQTTGFQICIPPLAQAITPQNSGAAEEIIQQPAPMIERPQPLVQLIQREQISPVIQWVNDYNCTPTAQNKIRLSCILDAFFDQKLLDGPMTREFCELTRCTDRNVVEECIRRLVNEININHSSHPFHVAALGYFLKKSASSCLNPHLIVETGVCLIKKLDPTTIHVAESTDPYIHDLLEALESAFLRMIDLKVEQLSKDGLYLRFDTVLRALSSNAFYPISFQAKLMQQSLLDIRNDETQWQRTKSASFSAFNGLIKIAGGVTGTDPSKVLDGISSVLEAMNTALEIAGGAEEVWRALNSLGQERAKPWAAALRDSQWLLFKAAASNNSADWDCVFQIVREIYSKQSKHSNHSEQELLLFGIVLLVKKVSQYGVVNARIKSVEWLIDLFQNREMWGIPNFLRKKEIPSAIREETLRCLLQLASEREVPVLNLSTTATLALQNLKASFISKEKSAGREITKRMIADVNAAILATPARSLSIDLCPVGSVLSRIILQKDEWPTLNNPSIPAYIPRPLQALYGDYLKSFDNPLLQQTLHYYLEPDARPFPGADTHFPLRSRLEAFEEADQQKDQADIFLLHGEVGAGKSSAARLSQQRLWKAWENTTGSSTTKPWVPVLIELKQISGGNKDFLTERLQAAPFHYTLKNIQELQAQYSFFFIFDGLDECPQAVGQNFIQDIQLPNWEAKLLITARTEWLNKAMDARTALKTNRLTSKVYRLTEAYIAPFEKEQIDAYLMKRFKPTQISEGTTWETYRDFLQKQEELSRMTASPVMLHILCTILPELIAHNQASAVYTRVGLYDTFLDLWFEREIDKGQLLGQDSSLPSSTVSTSQLKREFLDYTQQLAFRMFCEGTLLIERRYSEPSRMKAALESFEGTSSEKTDPWAFFFDNEDMAIQQAQRSSPLSLERFLDEKGIRYHRYQFIHKSFMEHATASVLWEGLDDSYHDINTCLKLWNHRYLTDNRGVLSFLLDRLSHSLQPRRAELEKRLLDMVLASRGNPVVAKAASNAMTILNEGKFSFYKKVPNRDLSGICIPQADLMGIRLMDFDCSHMDATGVNFHDAVLVGTKLCHANLTNTKFLAGTSFVLSSTEVRTMILHPNRSGVAIYGEDSDIVIVRLVDGVIEKRLKGHMDVVKSLAFGPDDILASGSCDNTIRLWDLKNEEAHLKTLGGHTDLVSCLAFGPDGVLASGSMDNTIRLWDLKRDEPHYKTLENHMIGVLSLAFSPDGILAMGSWDPIIRLWDPKEENVHLKILEGHTHSISSLTFSSDGLLASGSRDNTIRLWDPKREYAHHKTLIGHTNSVSSLAFSPNGLLASGSWDKTIRLWDPKQEEAHFKTLEGHTNSVLTVSFGSDGAFVSGSLDKTICLWNLKPKEVYFKTLESHTDGVRSLTVGPDGMIVSGGGDKTICLWDLKREEALFRTLEGHMHSVSSLVFSSNGLLASGSRDNTIRLWDPKQKEAHLKTLEGHKADVISLAFGPGGILASGSWDNTIRLWDPKLEDPHFKTINGLPFAVSSLAFAPNGMLVSGSSEKFISLWDPERDYAGHKILVGHTHSISSLAFSSDGVLASGSEDNTIHLWDSKREYAPLKTLKGHSDGVKNLLFTQDNRWLISGNSQEILVWNSRNWNEAPHHFSFGAEQICFHDPFLIVTHGRAIYTLDLSNFPHSFQWVMAQSTLWLQGCDISGAQGMSLPTQQLLKKEGAIINSLELIRPDSEFDHRLNPLINDNAGLNGTSTKEAAKKDKSVGCIVS